MDRASWRGLCMVSLVILSLSFPSLGQSANMSMSMEDVDSTIRDYAFKAVAQRRTGGLSRVPLPASLSGITASALRLRSASFWSRGANVSSFYIPPRVLPVPYVKRIVVVYEDLGSWSASYFKVPGYSLVAPVVGCFVYDATNATSAGIRELRLNVLGDPMEVTFPRVALPGGLNSTIQCAAFGPDGSVQLSNTSSENTCSTTSTGHLAIVVPLLPPVVPAPAPAPAPSPTVAVAPETAGSRWLVLLAACVGGVLGLGLACLVWVGIGRLARKKRIEGMESKAEDGEALGVFWIGRSKMPSAAMTRTQPAIETGSVP